MGNEFADKRGYVRVFRPDHPSATPDGYVYKHRLVMEASLERYLRRDELVKFKDGNRGNCRINNLALMTWKRFVEETIGKWKKQKDLGGEVDEDQVLRLLWDGYTKEAIAKMLNVPLEAVLNVLGELRLTYYKKDKDRNQTWFDRVVTKGVPKPRGA
jgi:hypothetical protein